MVKEQEKEKGRALYIVRGILLVLFNLILYSLLLLAIIWVCQGGYRFAYQVFGAVTVAEAPGEDISITIEPEESVSELSKELENGGVIVNRYSFLVRTRLSMADGRGLREGDYILNTSMTYEEILDKILKSEVK